MVVADVLKRKGEDGHDIVESKKAKLDIPLEEQMLMSTIPYHSIGYEEQVRATIFTEQSFYTGPVSITQKCNITVFIKEPFGSQ